MGALMAITGAFNTAAEATVSVGVASIGGVVTVAGLAITGAISATHLAIAPMAAPSLSAPGSPRPMATMAKGERVAQTMTTAT